MAKEDLSLPVEMERLEIQPAKVTKTLADDNPFILTHQKRNLPKSAHTIRCPCQKKCKNVGINKKKTNKVLKEPVLKFLQQRTKTLSSNCLNSKATTNIAPLHDNLNLCALVDNCNQLRISSGKFIHSEKESKSNDGLKWWTNDGSLVPCDSSQVLLNKETVERSQIGSCSQQALNPPCDVTIDELASYFETLVHIPKKMSSMAEMMYI